MQTPIFPTLFLLATIIGQCGCSSEPEDHRLTIIKTLPDEGGGLPSNRAIRVQFDDYLDPVSVDELQVELRSGELEVRTDVSYDPIEKIVLIRPLTPLRVGVGYELNIPPDTLQSVSGARLREGLELRLRSVGPSTADDRPARLQFADDIKPIFDGSCGCHGPSPKLFPDLTPENLIRQKSARQPDRLLVMPGLPLESYLIQRLLPDYPTVQGPTKELSTSEAQTLVRWVTQLSGF